MKTTDTVYNCIHKINSSNSVSQLMWFSPRVETLLNAQKKKQTNEIGIRYFCAVPIKIVRTSSHMMSGQVTTKKKKKEDRFLHGAQIAYMIYDNFRVDGAHDTALDYANLFSITFRTDDVQEFDTRWHEILYVKNSIR